MMSSSGDLSEVAVYMFVLITSLCLFAISYQLLLHPLRDYPGPFIAKFTDAYAGHYAVRKCLHLATYFDHLKYGPVYRPAPNRLLFNTSSALRAIYLHPLINKAHIYKHTQFNPQTNIFGTLSRSIHRQKRRIYGSVLSDRSMRDFEPVMKNEVNVFLSLLGESVKNREGKEGIEQVVDMSTLCERLTTDIAGQLAFGMGMECQLEEENRGFPRAMVGMNWLVGIFMAWPLTSKLFPLFRRLNQKNGVAFSMSIQNIINKRMALPRDAKHDFYALAGEEDIESNADGFDKEGLEKLGNSQLWAEAVFLIPAGGTTLSTLLSASFFYLSHSSSAYKLLAHEIRTTFSNADDMNGAKLKGCKYLKAVIDETLRMAPPFLGTLWREIDYTSENGSRGEKNNVEEVLVIDGNVIPRGTMVGVNPYAIMHNEKYFPEPFVWRPERWLDDEDEENMRAAREAFTPFGLGETACLGKSMAYQEASLVIAKTLFYFDFRLAPGEKGKLGQGDSEMAKGRRRKEEYQLYDVAVADHEGPNLVFRGRGEDWRGL